MLSLAFRINLSSFSRSLLRMQVQTCVVDTVLVVKPLLSAVHIQLSSSNAALSVLEELTATLGLQLYFCHQASQVRETRE